MRTPHKEKANKKTPKQKENLRSTTPTTTDLPLTKKQLRAIAHRLIDVYIGVIKIKHTALKIKQTVKERETCLMWSLNNIKNQIANYKQSSPN
jgi:hypothetical protein